VLFKNRIIAGQQLAKKLSFLKDQKKIIILGIPRGGVVVAKEISKLLKAPLDIIVTKKIPAPFHPELALGAVGIMGEPVIDEELIQKMKVDQKYLDDQINQLRKKVIDKEKQFRQEKPPLDLKEKTIILIDDGIATGATIIAAIKIIRQSDPSKLIVATPVIAKDTLSKIEKLADEVIYLQAPSLFFAVGQFYKDFEQVLDDEVKYLLK